MADEIGERYLAVLELIAQKINGEISWAIAGSTSLILQGIDVEWHDVDIVTDKVGAYRFNQIFKNYEVSPVSLDTHSDLFESYIGEFCINNIKVEIIGDFHIKVNKRKELHATMILFPLVIEINNIAILIVSLEDELFAYQKMNRPKDQEKIRKIKEILIQNL